jgi:hypothetical protein
VPIAEHLGTALTGGELQLFSVREAAAETVALYGATALLGESGFGVRVRQFNHRGRTAPVCVIFGVDHVGILAAPVSLDFHPREKMYWLCNQFRSSGEVCSDPHRFTASEFPAGRKIYRKNRLS